MLMTIREASVPTSDFRRMRVGSSDFRCSRVGLDANPMRIQNGTLVTFPGSMGLGMRIFIGVAAVQVLQSRSVHPPHVLL